MYKIATLGSGNPRNFTWNIIQITVLLCQQAVAPLIVVMSRESPGLSWKRRNTPWCILLYEQKLSFYLSGATTDSARQVLLTQHQMQQKHRAWVSL